MRREDRVRILDMIEEAENTASFIAGRGRDDLDRDRMLFLTIDHISAPPSRTVATGSIRRRPRAMTIAPGGPPDDLPV